MKRIISVLSVLLVVCLIFSGMTAVSAPQIDLDRGITISIKYEHNGTPISNVRFKAYKIADLSSGGELVLTSDFARYNISLDGLNADKLKTLSDTLSAYIVRDEIAPIAVAVTNDKGIAPFGFSKKQTAGLFLITGEKKQIGKFIYTPESLMLSLPTASDDGSKNLYDVIAAAKSEVTEAKDKTQIEVNKVWKGDGGENRPQSVTVQLMKNDEVYDEVTLSESNNWRFKWTDLDSDYTWTVAEKNVPKNYTVQITHSGKNYIIVNTFSDTTTTKPSDTTRPGDTTRPNDTTRPGDTTRPNDTTRPGDTTKPNDTTRPGDTTRPSDTTRPGDTTKPNDTTRPGDTTRPNDTTRPDISTTTPSKPNTPSVPSTTAPPEKIPQTGMLEWPIPLMFEFGAAFIVIGVVFCIRKKNEDEK